MNNTNNSCLCDKLLNARNILIGSLAAALFFIGCAKPRIQPSRDIFKEWHYLYKVEEGLVEEVTFQSQKAIDNIQMGLIYYAKCNGEGIVKVGSDEFFPKYFTMVDQKLDYGRSFYISENEASAFAMKWHDLYKSKVTSE